MRKLYLIDSVDPLMYETFTKEFDELVADGKGAITIELCSSGGDENIAYAIYDKIVNCPNDVYVMAYGEVQSAAVLILAAGDKRSAGKNTVFMVHDSELDENPTDKRDVPKAMAQLERGEEQYYKLMAKHSKISYEEWRRLSKETTYFTAEEALAFGIIDKVIGCDPLLSAV